MFLAVTQVPLFERELLVLFDICVCNLVRNWDLITCLAYGPVKAWWTATVKTIYFIHTRSIIETGAAVTLVDICRIKSEIYC